MNVPGAFTWLESIGAGVGLYGLYMMRMLEKRYICLSFCLSGGLLVCFQECCQHELARYISGNLLELGDLLSILPWVNSSIFLQTCYFGHWLDLYVILFTSCGL